MNHKSGSLEEIRATYRKMVEIYDEGRGTKKFSEMDTQCFLIEPVFRLAGWDILDPEETRRANRSSKEKNNFDIEFYIERNSKTRKIRPYVVVESKSLYSDEFNMKCFRNGKRVGFLNEKYLGKMRDGIGQARAYAWRGFAQHNDSFNKASTNPLVVLTNGYEWTIFDNANFLSKYRIQLPIEEVDIASNLNLENKDFEKEIVQRLRRPL